MRSALMPAASSSASFICRCVALAGCSTQVRASATWVAIWARRRFFMNVSAAARPPATPKLTTPQDPSGRYFAASAASESPASEGWRTQATFGWAAKCSATTRPFSACRAMRRCRLSSPRLMRKAFCGDWMEPRSRMSWAVALVM